MSTDILLVKPDWSEFPSFPPIFKDLENNISRLRSSEEYIKNYFTPRGIKREDLSHYNEIAKIIDITNKWPLPYGLLCIASFLEKYGYSAKIVSLDYYKWKYRGRKNWLYKILKRFLGLADIIGVTCTTCEFEKAIKILKISKEINPNVTTIVGGPHVTFLSEEVMKLPYIDIVVRGEGEKTTLDLLRVLENGRNINKVRGITFKKNNKISSTPAQKPIDLAKSPMPAYHLLPKDAIDKFVIYTMFSRGCPYNCLNCVETRFWPGLRFKTPQSALNELEYLKEKFKIKFIHLADSYFFANPKFSSEICKGIRKRDLDLLISCNVRPDFPKYIGDNMIQQIIKANFVELVMGSESGSDKILKILNRGHTFEDTLQTLKKLRNKPFFIRTNWMVGCPGENHKTAFETAMKLRYLFNHNLIFDAVPRQFIPFPGLDPFKNPSKYGIQIHTYDWKKYIRFVPVHETTYLNKYEIYSYILLMYSIRLNHFIRIAKIQNEIQHIKKN